MAYQLGYRLTSAESVVEDGSHRAPNRSDRMPASWRTLDQNRRLELIDRALAGVADIRLPDGHPVAL